jgi:hypothetical protein
MTHLALRAIKKPRFSNGKTMTHPNKRHDPCQDKNRHLLIVFTVKERRKHFLKGFHELSSGF